MFVDPMAHELLDISNNKIQDNDNISNLEALDQYMSWRNNLATEEYQYHHMNCKCMNVMYKKIHGS